VRAGELGELLRTARVPGEFEARRRSWPVVRAAFAEREPVPRPSRYGRPLLAAAAAAAVLAAAVSAPGRAVLETARDAVLPERVVRAGPALFSLPAAGRILVESDAGAWVVSRDGSKRLLAGWREASWSPFGRFVVAARANELAALEPNGDVRWKLSRPDVRFPRWAGSRTDTRIAYLTGSRLHVVAGDGTGDVDAGGLPAAARVAPAWRPGSGHVVAYADTRGRVYLYDADAGSVAWRSALLPGPRLLDWSSDGRRLAVVTRDKLAVLDARNGRAVTVRFLRGIADASFAPGSHRIALARPREVLLLDGDRPRARPMSVFAGAGRFTDVAWSPDGRWLLVAWKDADQWVFVRSARARRIDAVSGIAGQFDSSRFPRVSGWCCAS
jgi:hypothetical protein